MVEGPLPSVTQIIAEQVKHGSQPQKRDDPYKVGLVIEGGGMRGVVSAGMACALDALNAVDAFDSVYSVSAGSCNATYFVSKQTSYGITIYYEDVNKKAFIDFSRPMRGQPIVDVPYLTHKVMIKDKPLNWEKIVESPVALHIYTTSAKHGEIVDISKFEEKETIHNAMHYSGRIPVVAGMPVIVDKEAFTDGTFLVGRIPLYEAIADECTHVLALLSKPEQASLQGIAISNAIFRRFLQREYPQLAKVYRNGIERTRQAQALIYQAKTGSIEGVEIATVTPSPNSKKVGSLEKNATVLFNGALDAYARVMEVFREYDLPVNTDITLKR